MTISPNNKQDGKFEVPEKLVGVRISPEVMSAINNMKRRLHKLPPLFNPQTQGIPESVYQAHKRDVSKN